MTSFIIHLLLAIAPNPTVITGISPINEIEVQGPSVFSLAHKEPSIKVKCTYAITTNGEAKKIAAHLSSPLPENTTLSATLQAPKGAISMGTTLLSAESKILVSSISKLAEKNLSLVYTLSSTNEIPARTYPNAVIFTVID